MVTLLRHENYVAVPWKNGGGVTREIAVHKDATGGSDFLWRISVATVSKPGPFSIFEGIDRSIAVLDGAGIVLHSEKSNVILTPESDPFAFEGETPIDAGVVNGETTDLNAMTRRGHFTHSMEKLSFERSIVLDGTADEMIVVFNGEVTVTTSEGQLLAQPLDALIGVKKGAKIQLSPTVQAEVFIIRISHAIVGKS